MIINEWDITRGLYFVRNLDNDHNMFIGTYDECKQFQINYNIEMENIKTTIEAVEDINLDTLSKNELKKHCKRLLVLVKHIENT